MSKEKWHLYPTSNLTPTFGYFKSDDWPIIRANSPKVANSRREAISKMRKEANIVIVEYPAHGSFTDNIINNEIKFIRPKHK